MERRQLLAATTGLVAAGGAGCSSITGRGERRVELGGVTLLNTDTSAHEFDVRIEKDGERIHESGHTLEGKHFADVGCDWMGSTGEYVLAARTTTGDWQERNITPEIPDGECASVMVEYEAGTFDFNLGGNCEFGCQ